MTEAADGRIQDANPELAMLEHANTFITAGIWLSVGAFAVLAGVLWHVWRRDVIPEVAYGGVALAPRRLRWLWTVALLGSIALGAAADPFLVTSTDMNAPAEHEAAPRPEVTRTIDRTIPLPFYRYERKEVTVDGVPQSSHELRGLVLPTPFLLTLLAYFFLVVRFKPDGRWTRRILYGRKEAGAGDNDPKPSGS